MFLYYYNQIKKNHYLWIFIRLPILIQILNIQKFTLINNNMLYKYAV